MQVVLSLVQLSLGGLIEGSTSLLGVAALDCVIPQLSGSSGAVATFISQCRFNDSKELKIISRLYLTHAICGPTMSNLAGPTYFMSMGGVPDNL